MLTKMTRRNSKGFTLIEIVAVLIVLGILAAVVLSRFSGNEHEAITAMEEYKSVIRYVQSRALSTEAIWGVENQGNRYRVYRVQNGTQVYFSTPGMDADASHWVSLPSGFIITSGTISFDSWGVPYVDAMAQTEQITDRMITMSGTYQSTTTIVRFTGTVL
jgi:MSHA pilin protein MshC